MTRDSKVSTDQRCPSCGGANNCAIARGEQQCWCMAEPIGVPLPVSAVNSADASCYCARCLQQLATERNSPQLHKPDIPR